MPRDLFEEGLATERVSNRSIDRCIDGGRAEKLAVVFDGRPTNRPLVASTRRRERFDFTSATTQAQ
jgi:hypothetical protein